MKRYILSIDQGTTSTRAFVFDNEFRVVGTDRRFNRQIFPADGLVEHSPYELLGNVVTTARNALSKARIDASEIAGIGITNQRETTVVWDKKTGWVLNNAIVWQDRRTVEYCETLKRSGLEQKVRDITGLTIDSYFSATKLKWILDRNARRDRPVPVERLLFGNIDTWLIWNLTRERNHFTDATNASRTMLYDIHRGCWSEELAREFEIPLEILPAVKDSADQFGVTDFLGAPIPIYGVVGDQQAATIGQACLRPGLVKSTYGTGCFIVMNTGSEAIRSRNGLLTTIAYRIKGETTYALEGSIFIAGAAIDWLKDKLQVIEHARDTEELYSQSSPEENVYLVPAFVGLGAPYWDGNARGAIVGMTRNSGVPELVRAAIDSSVYQTKDLMVAFEQDSGIPFERLRVDGGMAKSACFAQFLSDVLGEDVECPEVLETTVLGAAYLAAYQSGIIKEFNDIQSYWRSDWVYKPKLDRAKVERLYGGWQDAVRRVLSDPHTATRIKNRETTRTDADPHTTPQI